MPFGQIVIGPPGSGKSTYCNGMQQFLSAIGRKTSVINLDPANDRVSYPCALDIRDFTKLEDIMKDQNLGPNGGIMYALEEVENSLDDFVNMIQSLGKQDYLIFDCPGQVELFTHHSAIHKIFKKLEKLDYRLAVIHLIDSYYITSPTQYISILLLALRSMLQLDMPHINVLSKVDLLKNYGELPYSLDYYTEVQDLSYMFPHIEAEQKTVLGKRYAKLTEAIADMVEDFGLVSFEVLAVEDKKSMINLLTVIDKATGYMFGSTEIGGDTVWAEATRQGGYMGIVQDIQERWIDHKEDYDEEEEKEQEKLIKKAEEESRPLTEEEEWEAALEKWEKQNGTKMQR